MSAHASGHILAWAKLVRIRALRPKDGKRDAKPSYEDFDGGRPHATRLLDRAHVLVVMGGMGGG
jgi:hypothetical protein